MESKVKNDRARGFVSAVASSLSAALSLATGEICSFEVSQIHDSRQVAAAQFRIMVSGNLSGEYFIELCDPLLTQLRTRISKKGENAAESGEQAITAALESAMRTLSDVLNSQYGQVGFAVSAVSGLKLEDMWTVPLDAVENCENGAVQVTLDKALLECLSLATMAEGLSDDEAAPIHPANLKLVMDVELDVSLRFGQRLMPLREVLELSSGSVIELDRMVEEPVELLLDGKLVARGEAVIVDGNYGLRVTEIPHSVESQLLNCGR